MNERRIESNQRQWVGLHLRQTSVCTLKTTRIAHCKSTSSQLQLRTDMADADDNACARWWDKTNNDNKNEAAACHEQHKTHTHATNDTNSPDTTTKLLLLLLQSTYIRLHTTTPLLTNDYCNVTYTCLHMPTTPSQNRQSPIMCHARLLFFPFAVEMCTFTAQSIETENWGKIFSFLFLYKD